MNARYRQSFAKRHFFHKTAIDHAEISVKKPVIAGVAQLVEHPICNRAVGSSSLSASTISSIAPCVNTLKLKHCCSFQLMWVDYMVDHFSTYLYQKRGFYYFSRRVPKEVQHCHSKQRIVFALNARSRAKAVKYAQVMCQRLDERWLPMRLDALEFGNVMTNC